MLQDQGNLRCENVFAENQRRFQSNSLKISKESLENDLSVLSSYAGTGVCRESGYVSEGESLPLMPRPEEFGLW